MGQAHGRFRALVLLTTIRDAASLVLIRAPAGPTPRVLMGRRGRGAAFMPDKLVFPGGAVDGTDAEAPSPALSATCRARLSDVARPPGAFAAAALRELAEETGLSLAAHQSGLPRLAYVFRAVTPPGRLRRFDARFFLAAADAVAGDPDDFARADGELAELAWLPLDQAMNRDLPRVTRAVLVAVARRLPDLGPPPHVPFLRPGAGAI